MNSQKKSFPPLINNVECFRCHNYGHVAASCRSRLFQSQPDLPARTVLKTIFRKSQVRVIADKYGINLNCQIVSLAAKQWECCFLEMLERVPEKNHPS